jgi:hypothetical protein
MVFTIVQRIPQIVRNVHCGQRRGIALSFVFYIPSQRVLVLLYLSRYQFNIFEKVAGRFTATAIAWIVLQVSVLVFQKHCGTLFFVPRLIRPKQFEYKPSPEALGIVCAVCQVQIDTVAKSVVTRCGHYFHMKCLRKWFAEKYTCPLCMRSAPPMDT